MKAPQTELTDPIRLGQAPDIKAQAPLSNQETQSILDCLRQTAAKTLERKRRLGHYAVIWQNHTAVTIGEDAPSNLPESVQNPNSSP